MGRKSKGKSKVSSGPDGASAPLDRGTLAQCLNATSQIAAECNSILRDLLRGRSPHHQDLQRLASQVLMGNAMNLQELQKRMESQQATLAELLKVLKPVSGTSSLELGGADGAYALPLPSESVIKGWDSARDGPYSGASPARRRRSNKVATRQEGLTKRERYLAVEGYWRSMSEEGRRAILAAPVCRVVEAATAENGAEAGKEVSEGVRLLKRNASRHACYWRCPCCELRTADPRGFLEHMAQYHEEVQYACEDTPLLCTTCGQEVVGAFYHTGDPREPSAVRCMRCAWESSPPAAPGVIPKGWAIHVPQPTGLLDRSWSGSEEGSEALTASSRSSEASATGSDGEEHFSDPDADGSEGALAAETGALEARIRSGADGLLQAIVDRIDALSKEDSHQFATAKAAVWQQAQSLLHSASSGQEIGVVKEVPPGPGSEQRTAAVARLADAEGYPNQQEVLNEAMELLDPSEQQDLVALVARKYNPHARASQSQGKKAPYEPPCVSLLRLEATDGGRVGEDALAGDPSESEVVVPIPGTGLTDLPELSDSDVLRAHSWWTDHLIQKSRSAATATGGAADDTYLLQWIYGNVAHGASDEFHERQRQACGTKTAERTIMDAYGEVAETWRHLAATMDRKRAITTLRDNVVEDMESVATFNPATGASLFAQANEFIAEVAADHTLASAAAGTAEMDGAWAQRALTKLQRFHQLKDEASIRYAQALIDREIAVLELAEMVDQHECDVSERELQTVDAALAAARQDLADAEAELARTQAEGPPLHRKRDLLDRVNKEAEHRERLRELQQHIAACKDRIASEEAFGTSTRRRREEAAAALSEGRIELQGYLERRQALDRACHAVLAAQERDKGQELTDAYVDARIKAVWQVVAGVAEGIRLLNDRYSPGSTSKEAARYQRCTGLAKNLSIELDERICMWWEELDKLRRRAADLACVDAGHVVENAALEVVRQALEEKAAAAREAATLDLLRELEAEEAAKKAAESKKSKKKAGKSAKKGGKEDVKTAAEEAPAPAEVEPPGGAAGDSGGSGEDAEADGEPDRDEDLEYEAALERRRQELERQEAERRQREAELLQIAQEASMRESANGKAKVGAKPAVGGATVAVVASKKGAGAEGDKAGKDKPRVVIVHRPVPIAVPRSKADVKAAGAPAPPAPAAPPPPPPPGKPQDAATGAAAGAAGGDGEMRIITFYGDWMCFCNKVNRLWDTCVCGQIPPCRDWVRGRCTYKDRCRFSHPPFELPDNLPRPKSPIAKPGPDAVVYKKSRNPAAAAAAAARHAVAVITPEVKPVAAPKTVAATAAAPAPPAKPAAAVAPPPLKPAPWAGVKPGAAIQPPAAPPAVYSSSRAAVAPGGPPPPPPPRQPVAEADSGHSSGFGLPESLAEPAAPPSSAGFDIFGSNPLVHVLDSQPHAAQQQHPVSSAFSALSLGSSLGTAPQAGAPPTVQLFGPGGGLGGSFLGGTPTDGSVPAASVTFQPGGFHNGPAPGAMPPLNQQYGGGLGGLSGSLGNGNGLHGSLGQELRGSVLGLGSGGDFGGDDWGDLQLQLPSDLGEILGADPVPAQHAVPPQQMVLGTDLYGSGANGNGHPPGWGAL